MQRPKTPTQRRRAEEGDSAANARYKHLGSKQQQEPPKAPEPEDGVLLAIASSAEALHDHTRYLYAKVTRTVIPSEPYLAENDQFADLLLADLYHNAHHHIAAGERKIAPKPKDWDEYESSH